ncbi:MAG: hypothetical protein JKY71_03040 [Alphaproteobacteria bacterium]|nr:hypothetical protein [Alphaproteobacteria bacterium]
MVSWLINETSEEGPVEALDLALKQATESVSGHPHSDIILTDIKKLSKGWRAELNVFAAARRKKHGIPDVAPAPAPQENEEADHKKEKKKLDAHKYEFDQFYHDWLVNELGTEYAAMQEMDNIMILIAEISFEQEVWAAAPAHNFTAIHFVPEGSLWELAKTRQPDIDLYEAAHRQGPEKDTIAQGETGGHSPKPRPGKRSVLSPELTDD